MKRRDRGVIAGWRHMTTRERVGRGVGAISGLVAVFMGSYLLLDLRTPNPVFWFLPILGLCAVMASVFDDPAWLYPLGGVSCLMGGFYFMALPLPYGLLGWTWVGYLAGALLAVGLVPARESGRRDRRK